MFSFPIKVDGVILEFANSIFPWEVIPILYRSVGDSLYGF